MDRKALSLELTVLKSDRAKGIITAIANTGNNVDRQKDNLLPGCWSKVIAENQQPPFLWNHNIQDFDVRGKVIRLEELSPGDSRIPMNRDSKAFGTVSGLLADIQCAMETQAGRDAFALLDGGFVKELSVNINNAPEDEEIDRKGVRNVKLVNLLLEISAVLKGASYGTAVLMTKALELAKGEPGTEASLLQAIHELSSPGGVHCKVVIAEGQEKSDDPEPTKEEPSTDEPIPTAAALDVTALTANVIAFSRTLGALKGDQAQRKGDSHA